MPSLKHSPGLADIDVCYGKHAVGSEGVQRALRNSQGTLDDSPLVRRRTHGREWYDDFSAQLTSGTEVAESLRNKEGASKESIREDHENMKVDGSALMNRGGTGLPPTPPIQEPSENREAEDDKSLVDLDPQFVLANGVRSAIQTQSSGLLSATPIQQVSPPTPDASPRSTINQAVGAGTMSWVEESRHVRLEPGAPTALLSPDSHLSPQSFTTAHEGTLGDIGDEDTSDFRLDYDDGGQPLGNARNNSTGTDATRLNSLKAGVEPLQDPEITERGGVDGTDDLRRLMDREIITELTSPSSPPSRAQDTVKRDGQQQFARYAQMQVTDVPSLPGACPVALASSAEYVSAKGDKEAQRLLIGATTHQMAFNSGLAHPAEDINNTVYQRIQEEKVKRHSTVSASSGSIAVGILVSSSLNSSPRTIRRQPKRFPLKSDGDNEDNLDSPTELEPSKWSTDPLQLGGKTLPAIDAVTRNVSSPARLAHGRDPGEYVKPRSIVPLGPLKEHKLRHVSANARLSGALNVSRPPQEHALSSGENMARGEDGDHVGWNRTSGSFNDVKVPNNIAVKRSTKPADPINGVKALVDSFPEPVRYIPDGKLRHFSREKRLEKFDSMRRTSNEHAAQPTLQTMSGAPFVSPSGFVPLSPRKSLDARNNNSITTPISVSGFSDHTTVELCEASGVRLYPHNNHSLLVVEHGSRLSSRGEDSPNERSIVEATQKSQSQQAFAAQVDPPTPVVRSRTNSPVHDLDSPLMNPRSAPVPPAFHFISPTPVSELERDSIEDDRRALPRLPQRSISLKERARRYSETLFPRIGSLRRSNSTQEKAEPRSTYLTPTWRPEYDDHDSWSDEDADLAASDVLPRGGDTSNIEDIPRRRSLFPRAMSRRLPGFSGTGGFLIGNSLGLDRHGTNQRRHYVSTSTRTYERRSEPLPVKSPQQQPRMSLRQIAYERSRKRSVVQRFRESVRSRQLKREAAEHAKRQERLRSAIGPRVVYDET